MPYSEGANHSSAKEKHNGFKFCLAVFALIKMSNSQFDNSAILDSSIKEMNERANTKFITYIVE